MFYEGLWVRDLGSLGPGSVLPCAAFRGFSPSVVQGACSFEALFFSCSSLACGSSGRGNVFPSGPFPLRSLDARLVIAWVPPPRVDYGLEPQVQACHLLFSSCLPCYKS